MTATARPETTKEALEAGFSVIEVMDQSGDTKHIWDRNQPVEVEAMKSLFRSLRDKGYLVYKVNADGDKGEQLRTFDPNAERMIAAPPMVGG